MYLPSRTSSELHKLPKIEIVRSALRAEMFTAQELLRATQTFENQNVSLGASRRNVHLAGAPPSFPNFRKYKFFARRFAPQCSPRRGHYMGALQGYTTRVHYKGHYKGRYKGTLQGSFSKYLWVSPPN